MLYTDASINRHLIAARSVSLAPFIPWATEVVSQQSLQEDQQPVIQGVIPGASNDVPSLTRFFLTFLTEELRNSG